MDILVNIDYIIDKCISLEKSFDDIIDILYIVYSNREFTHDTIRDRVEKILSYKKQLSYLLTLPKIEQKTKEWYDARQSLITASDFAQALGEGKFGTKKQLIQKKCGFEEDFFNNSAPALKWGNMFEDVACQIYAARCNRKIYDFGLLRHPKIEHFGASPDGISDCGIMLEIKCPFKRKIDGTVPKQYYYQIQGQLDVCELNECDYFECEFFKSDNINEIFEQEYEYEKGVILEKTDGTYVYSPSSYMFKKEDIEYWVNENLTIDTLQVHYYVLTKSNCVRVYKDTEFLTSKLNELDIVWKEIKNYQADEDLYNKEIKNTKSSNSSAYKLTGFSFV